jgi:hypothetical protein
MKKRGECRARGDGHGDDEIVVGPLPPPDHVVGEGHRLHPELLDLLRECRGHLQALRHLQPLPL